MDTNETQPPASPEQPIAAPEQPAAPQSPLSVWPLAFIATTHKRFPELTAGLRHAAVLKSQVVDGGRALRVVLLCDVAAAPLTAQPTSAQPTAPQPE